MTAEPLRRGDIPCGRIAPDGTRSIGNHPSRIGQSIPVRLAAPVPTSERTKAREAPGISLTHDGATMPTRKGCLMKSWNQITHYAGFDWARDHHAVVIVDAQGTIVSDFEFATAGGLETVYREMLGLAESGGTLKPKARRSINSPARLHRPSVNPIASQSCHQRKAQRHQDRPPGRLRWPDTARRQTRLEASNRWIRSPSNCACSAGMRWL
jgi:hypothetical protein